MCLQVVRTVHVNQVSVANLCKRNVNQFCHYYEPNIENIVICKPSAQIMCKMMMHKAIDTST